MGLVNSARSTSGNRFQLTTVAAGVTTAWIFLLPCCLRPLIDKD